MMGELAEESIDLGELAAIENPAPNITPLVRRVSPVIIPFNSKEEWLAGRYDGIGASEAAAALGLSKWMSPLQLFRQKKRIDPPTEENDDMRWGHRHEVSVCSEFASLHPDFEVCETSWVYAHPDFPFIRATIDRDIRTSGLDDPKRILEAKSTKRDTGAWGESMTDGVNPLYIPQVFQQLGVCNADINHVAVIILSSNDYREYEVYRSGNEERIAKVFARVAAFWSSHIIANVEPEARTAADIITLFPESRKAEIEAADEIKDAHALLLEKRALVKSLDEQVEELKSRIQFYMGDFDTLVSDGSILATWRSGKPSMTFDGERFKAAHPGLWEEFQKDKKVSRTFLPKEIKRAK